ncbi:SRPBCC family protein [Nocardia aurantiaca]|uniref:SRPBCC family protein n=1 Tax=Nocardia aurantiaca TaxID=2675850 RepID=A0A6I3L0M3_9NOCA|nr:SRPBCC family protein [Nocardia aurantiaca]MTE14330.1 SRPBCC family protein [Nocardia aurantiaca]
MRYRYRLQESDDSTFRVAETRFQHSIDVRAEPAIVWAALTAQDALVAWTPLIRKVEWHTPPSGVGSCRSVTLGPGLVRLEERFYRWEEGRRMTFTVDSMSRPGFTHFAEDITLAPSAVGTAVVWSFAVSTADWLAPGTRFARPALSGATRSIVHGLARYVES